MDLDHGLHSNFLTDKEVLYFNPLVTLKLNNFAHLFVLDDVSVASKVLFKMLQEAFLIELLRESLQSGQGFTSIALLYTNV